MYLILTASKDTYVTNRKTSDNDGRYANVGDAASLDLFKLQSENKNLKPQAEIVFNSVPNVNDTLTITNAIGIEKVYTFIDGPRDPVAGSIDRGVNPTISSIVEATYSLINDSQQTFTAIEKSNNKIILEQDRTGFEAETAISTSNATAISVENFNIREISKILLYFDYTGITNHFDISASTNFSAKLKLFDISTGNVKPKNFYVTANPLSRSFDEGIGRDIYSFGQRGWANYLTASQNVETLQYDKWSLSGLRSKGSRGDENIDIITGSGDTDYNNKQLFSKGDEDLSIDITDLITETLSGDLNNNGLVLEFGSDTLKNSYTYFVKRFGSRHLKNKLLSPRIEFSYNDSFVKSDNIIYTNSPTRLYLENRQGNFYKDLPFTGGGVLDAAADQLSVTISYEDFTVSEFATQTLDSLGNKKTGYYQVDFNIDMFSDHLHGYLTGSGEVEADLKWNIIVGPDHDLNTTVKSTKIKILTGSNELNPEKFIISDIRHNFNKPGTKDEKMFFVTFIDTIADLDAIKIPYRRKGENLGEVHYSVYDVSSGKEIIPFETVKKGTQMSYEDGDYYFTLYNSSLFKDRQIKFKFYAKEYNNLIIENDKVFRF